MLYRAEARIMMQIERGEIFLHLRDTEYYNGKGENVTAFVSPMIRALWARCERIKENKLPVRLTPLGRRKLIAYVCGRVRPDVTLP